MHVEWMLYQKLSAVELDLDQKRTPLAISAKMTSLAVNPRLFSPTSSEVKKLSKTLSIKIAKIRRIAKKKNYFAWLKRKVPSHKLDKIRSLKVK